MDISSSKSGWWNTICLGPYSGFSVSIPYGLDRNDKGQSFQRILFIHKRALYRTFKLLFHSLRRGVLAGFGPQSLFYSTLSALDAGFLHHRGLGGGQGKRRIKSISYPFLYSCIDQLGGGSPYMEVASEPHLWPYKQFPCPFGNRRTHVAPKRSLGHAIHSDCICMEGYGLLRNDSIGWNEGNKPGLL